MKKTTIKHLQMATADIEAISAGRHHNPHSFLGLHQSPDSHYLIINAFIPKCECVLIVVKESQKVLAKLTRVNQSDLFTAKLRRKKIFKYQLIVQSAQGEFTLDDPFSFNSSQWFTPLDIALLNQGNHPAPHKKLGAHCHQIENCTGVMFSVWAPNASHVAVVGDFNDWDSRVHPLTPLFNQQERTGYWNIFIPNVAMGSLYKYEIKNQQGKKLPLKADPYGIQSQYRPETASIVSQQSHYKWQDNAWLAHREQRNSRKAPISIYEVHLGSWRRDDNNHYLNYREIAKQLIPYTKDMGFTHIQLMPVSEFPFDGSWGYQPVGLFAPTSRFGTREDFQYFVDACHQANIGLLIDWVPGHFPSDEHGLATFDGSHLFEHADPKQGYHPDWNTLIYNYGRNEVANFLCASALHWLDDYHVDGIRVDAVASMLYLDYSRKAGEWIPNKHGGRENLEAVSFLQKFNEALYTKHPGTFSVAEESTSWPGVSKPTSAGGLGFGYKWNMGWMNDTLKYMSEDPIHRRYHHDKMTFGLVYAFDENFILPISHDEVVHGKGSMIERMQGDAWQQFANLRAYYGFMWTHPGKKLLFMGSEFAQGKEWDHDKALDWHQLDIHWHHQTQTWVKDLNHLYKSTPALFEKDCEADGFGWIDHQNSSQSILSFIRVGENDQQPVVVICNFTPQVHHHFKIGVPLAGEYHELINSDDSKYGGTNIRNVGKITSQQGCLHEQPHHITLSIPPLSTIVLSFSEGKNK